MTLHQKAGGLYMGFDGEVHNVSAERENTGYTTGQQGAQHFYSDFSLWDVFRTQLPWLLLSDESTAVGILRSFSEITQQQQAFPKWTTGSSDNGCMIGVPGAALALEACFAGLQDEFDLLTIQKALLVQATQSSAKNGRKDVDFYLQVSINIYVLKSLDAYF